MPQPNEQAKNEFTKFVIFWNWEYSMRNDKHINDYKRLLSGEPVVLSKEIYNNEISSCNTVQTLPSRKFHKLIGQFEYSLAQQDLWRKSSKGNTKFSFYQGSEHILTFILQNKFRYFNPKCVMGNKPTKGITSFSGLETLKILDDLPNTYKYKIIRHISAMQQQKKDLLYIDFSGDINTIIQSIKLHYENINKKNNLNTLNNYMYEYTRSATELSRLPKNKDKNLPRAVGLWLWDYLNDRNIKWENKGRAILAYKEKYENSEEQDLYIQKYGDRSQLEKLLATTDKCIREMKVLPMG